ncbi:hypothetical protein NDJ26_08690, partial [Vibrio parahaemolyticus]|uniref:hypothetical protein n=1 Tax=Vibrio parahaemolyticus TaxID=670 RepID=UPI00215EA88D
LFISDLRFDFALLGMADDKKYLLENRGTRVDMAVDVNKLLHFCLCCFLARNHEKTGGITA